MTEKMQIGMIYTSNLVFQENLKGKYTLNLVLCDGKL